MGDLMVGIIIGLLMGAALSFNSGSMEDFEACEQDRKEQEGNGDE